MKKWIWMTMVFTCILVLAACADEMNEPTPATQVEGSMPDVEVNDTEEARDGELMKDELMPVTVKLKNRDGNPVGTVKLIEEEDALRIMVDAKNLSEGTHGFHFHEKGLCEAPDFESAGGHYNPTGASHGLAHEEGPHAGDLPNLEVGPDGTVKEEFFVENLTLKAGEENSLFPDGGTALVIHAEADDGTTQPSGNSGDRIACGVVE